MTSSIPMVAWFIWYLFLYFIIYSFFSPFLKQLAFILDSSRPSSCLVSGDIQGYLLVQERCLSGVKNTISDISNKISDLFGLKKPLIYETSIFQMLNMLCLQQGMELWLMSVDGTGQKYLLIWYPTVTKWEHYHHGTFKPVVLQLRIGILYLIVRLQFWRSGECRVLLHCHYFQVYFDSGW